MAKGTKVSNAFSLLNVVLYSLSPSRLQPLSRRVLIPLRNQRSGETPLSEDLNPRLKREPQRLLWELLTNKTPSTSFPPSRTHSPVSLPSRPLRTTTLLYLSCTKELTSKWSRKLVNHSTSSRLERLTPSTLQEERRRPMLPSPRIKTLLMLPTRSELCD